MAAAGSAVGLGNIWRFPTEAASNGGGAFRFIYLFCCFLIGFPVMMAQISIGRKTGKNPVGAFKKPSDNRTFLVIGMWGVLCGLLVLSFCRGGAGWTLGYIFEEIFVALNVDGCAAWIADTRNGWLTALFSVAFMACTISIIRGGGTGAIERAPKTLMPLL